MTTNFPTSADAFTNPTSGDTLDNPPHDQQHADINDAMEAVQAKIGADNSAVSSSLDYRVAALEQVSGRRNLLYNGAMQVAQRGSSGAVGASEGYRCADRWKSYCTVNAAGTLSINTTDAPEGFNNSLNYACTTAEATATNETFVSQVLEGQDVQHIGYGNSWCKEVTVSFWVKSNVTGTFNVWFYRWDGTRHIGRSYTINSADIWEYKTVLVPADTSNAVANDNTQGWEARFYLAAQSTWTGGTEASAWSAVSDNNRAPSNSNINSSTSNYWRVTGVQVELGDKATPFEHRSFGEELALCQRYYEKSYAYETAPGTATAESWVGGSQSAGGATTGYIGAYWPYKVTKRSDPSVTVYDTAGTSGKVQRWLLGVSNTNGSAVVVDGSGGANGLLVYSSGTANAAALGFHYVAVSEL